MRQCICNALQIINTDARIISLNEEEHHKTAGKESKDASLFQTLQNYEKLSVLYLLYLQYKPKAWNKLTSQDHRYQKSYFIQAIQKFRDQFVCLARNVKAVSMDNMSKMLEMFFYCDPSMYEPPILKDSNDFSQIEEEVQRRYIPNKPFYFSVIVKLFPKAQQISIKS